MAEICWLTCANLRGMPISSVRKYGSGEITDRQAKLTLFPIICLKKIVRQIKYSERTSNLSTANEVIIILLTFETFLPFALVSV